MGNDEIKMKLTTKNTTLINLIRLQQAFGAGSLKSVKIYNILKQKDLLNTSLNKNILYNLLETKDADKILNIESSSVFKIINDCVKNNIFIITPEDSEYPERLSNIADMPIVLYIKGIFPDIDNMPVVSIVGPRKISQFGKKAAFSLSKRLAKSGIIIASGGALGADTCAHKGALACEGITIAVLGCGICYDYLPENRPMREAITKRGCVISEHPPFASTTKYAFPIRNRIVSALSLGTVVIEAGTKSGALITARLANEQGRDVFVIPGNPTAPEYKGSNTLLRDGAIPLLDANDVFNQYIASFPDKIDVEKAYNINFENTSGEKISKKIQLGLSKEAEIVYNNLVKAKFTADDLLELGLEDEQLIAALTELEIEGAIKALPGGSYELINN